MKINVLPKNLANMIAAGEVVERPASVVKELIENSIDAGAKNVTVEVQKGGMTYIRVTDDGHGIEPDEVETAFLRHATSKISTEEDLNSIYTLGFRGEALASIASVARVDIFTKTKDNTFGKTVTIEGGDITESSEAGCADGTTIIVRDLFFNTPARMKFLKSDASETAAINDTVNKMVLSHPGVKIKLISGGKTVCASSGDGELLSAIGVVYGRDFKNNVNRVDYSDEGIEVTGYVGNPSLARRDRRGQVFFINSRYIQSPVMSSAAGEAFQNSMMVGKFPFSVLQIRLNAQFVDVNVHPTKMQVRFSDDKKIYHAIYWAVKNALCETKHVPSITAKDAQSPAKTFAGDVFKKEVPAATQTDINLLRDVKYKTDEKIAEKKEPEKKEKTIDDFVSAGEFITKEKLSSLSSSKDFLADNVYEKKESETIEKLSKETEKKEEPEEEKRVKEVRFLNETQNEEQKEEKPMPVMLKAGIDFLVVGQVFATYIILQKGDEMLFVDQHAAQERIFFEELVAEFKEKELSSQYLLLPQTVTVSPELFDAVNDNIDLFSSLGFECESFGGTDFVIRSVPLAFGDHDTEDLFLSVANLLKNGFADAKKSFAEEALHTLACKRAIKGNSILSKNEMEALCEKVLSFESINTCPHGRPICVSMTKYEMEKNFKRIV